LGGTVPIGRASAHIERRFAYGTHRSDRAMLKYLVLSLEQSRRAHFIDGANGGYARAALGLKAQPQAFDSVQAGDGALTPAAG
jgi:hypothetical protein